MIIWKFYVISNKYSIFLKSQLHTIILNFIKLKLTFPVYKLVKRKQLRIKHRYKESVYKVWYMYVRTLNTWRRIYFVHLTIIEIIILLNKICNIFILRVHNNLFTHCIFSDQDPKQKIDKFVLVIRSCYKNRLDRD